MTEDDVIALFGAFDLFAGFSNDQFRLLAFVSEEIALGAGDLLYEAGDRADGAYVLISGGLESMRGAEKGAARYDISPPALVGEMGLMLVRPRATTITARLFSRLIFIPREGFMKLLRTHPELAQGVADTLRADLARYLDPIAGLGGRFSDP